MAATVTAPSAPAFASSARRRGSPRPKARASLRAKRGETLLLFAVAALAYYWLGYDVVTVKHVVVFDGMDRLLRAYMVWHDSPAKLAAIGFSYPPITSL